MNPRARKKEPPDLLLSLPALPITSNLLDAIAKLLLLNRFPLPAFPFPCPCLDFSLTAVPQLCQIGAPPQSVLDGCGGLPGSTRSPGGRLDLTTEQAFPAKGPRLTIDSGYCQDRCIYSARRAAVVRPPLAESVFSVDICWLFRWFSTGTWHSFDRQTRWAGSRTTDCYRVLGAIANSMVPLISSLCSSVGIYFPCTLSFSLSYQLELIISSVVEQLKCNSGTVVSCICGRCIPAFIICNVNIFRDLEQHLCVLGMCLMTLGSCVTALEQHRRMLGIGCCLLFGLSRSYSTFVCSDCVLWHLICILGYLVKLLLVLTSVTMLMPWDGTSFFHYELCDENPSVECTGC